MVSYERLAKLLGLDEREKELDTVVIESANETISYLCDRNFLLQEYTETVLCEKGIVRLRQWPIKAIGKIICNEIVLEGDFEFANNNNDYCIILGGQYERQLVTITYTAGYEYSDMPSSLVQAVGMIFLNAKRDINLKLQGNYNEKTINSIDDEIIKIIEPFIRKRL